MKSISQGIKNSDTSVLKDRVKMIEQTICATIFSIIESSN